jgi:hypothetical protein
MLAVASTIIPTPSQVEFTPIVCRGWHFSPKDDIRLPSPLARPVGGFKVSHGPLHLSFFRVSTVSPSLLCVFPGVGWLQPQLQHLSLPHPTSQPFNPSTHHPSILLSINPQTATPVLNPPFRLITPSIPASVAQKNATQATIRRARLELPSPAVKRNSVAASQLQVSVRPSGSSNRFY